MIRVFLFKNNKKQNKKNSSKKKKIKEIAILA